MQYIKREFLTFFKINNYLLSLILLLINIILMIFNIIPPLFNIVLPWLQGILYNLVTDQGYRDESSVIWETLIDVDGAGKYVNSSFRDSFPSNDTDKEFVP